MVNAELISKLYNEAIDFAYHNHDDSFTIDPQVIMERENKAAEKFQQKFAELIVKECCQIVDDQYQYRVSKCIKRHFGIEE